MAAIALLAILIVLVLMLTMGFVPFLYTVGWVLVAVIALVLCVMLVGALFRIFADWINGLTAAGRKRKLIEQYRERGHDTTKLERDLDALTEEAVRRRALGYTDGRDA